MPTNSDIVSYNRIHSAQSFIPPYCSSLPRLNCLIVFILTNIFFRLSFPSLPFHCLFFFASYCIPLCLCAYIFLFSYNINMSVEKEEKLFARTLTHPISFRNYTKKFTEHTVYLKRDPRYVGVYVFALCLCLC